MASYMDEGPSVNSSDREERINARRQRIQARIDAMSTGAEDPKVVDSNVLVYSIISGTTYYCVRTGETSEHVVGTWWLLAQSVGPNC